MKRGEVWLAEVGRKARPVVVLTRNEVIDVRELVTVAEVSTHIRGSSVEVAIDVEEAGLERPSVVNADGIHTVAQSRLTRRVGSLPEHELRLVCRAVQLAIGC